MAVFSRFERYQKLPSRKQHKSAHVTTKCLVYLVSFGVSIPITTAIFGSWGTLVPSLYQDARLASLVTYNCAASLAFYVMELVSEDLDIVTSMHHLVCISMSCIVQSSVFSQNDTLWWCTFCMLIGQTMSCNFVAYFTLACYHLNVKKSYQIMVYGIYCAICVCLTNHCVAIAFLISYWHLAEHTTPLVLAILADCGLLVDHVHTIYVCVFLAKRLKAEREHASAGTLARVVDVPRAGSMGKMMSSLIPRGTRGSLVHDLDIEDDWGKRILETMADINKEVSLIDTNKRNSVLQLSELASIAASTRTLISTASLALPMQSSHDRTSLGIITNDDTLKLKTTEPIQSGDVTTLPLIPSKLP